jgi:hypothetical protein
MEWNGRNGIRGARNIFEERRKTNGGGDGSWKQVRRNGSEKGTEYYMKKSEVKGECKG